MGRHGLSPERPNDTRQLQRRPAAIFVAKIKDTVEKREYFATFRGTELLDDKVLVPRRPTGLLTGGLRGWGVKSDGAFCGNRRAIRAQAD